ncbi:HD domain-containing protein [Paracrocinitomix mangrovi]|uniref:adenylate/guanylate cyclase domain-containing protein n=1 Tax=Paracrocinitomix mangrovi TaxID=2862509 RepID=UPI001C8DC982|nr:adenylate/guanylate cyclase domain-containing protein [Paracrocinitomix mangrovi]UKN02090.1 HD domain-containing protein [Paracrocinitomix mangrovi]
MAEKDELQVDDILKTNRRLNEQVKELTQQNESLLETIRELEGDIKELQKKSGNGKTSVKKKGITVMYISFGGFKSIQEGESTDDLYDLLDEIYIKFDEIADKHKLERIKSIGDDYICAGGITEKRSTNPIDICLAALKMKAYLQELKAAKFTEGDGFWNVKIGIHSGNGMVEEEKSRRKKATFNLTGEVINTVPRVASLCEAGEIVISDYTYEIVKGYFSCEYTGDLPVKYRGNMGLYQLKRIKRIYSEDRKEGIKPNADFTLKYHLKEFNDIEEKVIDFLIKNLPGHLFYHDYTHTIDVVNQAELIGYGEGVSDHQILLLKTAALFHDTGHTIESNGHEEHSCTIAREWLTEYNYSEEQISEICNIIMATKMPPNPQTLLQRIICDSDLDYLGRTDFIPTSNALYKELEAIGVMNDINEWNKLQIKFLSGHQFYTATSRRLREVNKQSQIDRIQKLVVEEGE